MTELHPDPDADAQSDRTREATTAADGAPRPVLVTLGLGFAYVVAAGCLAHGSGDPSATGGTGASGLGLIVLGVVELMLATLALGGRPLARACLVVAMVFGGVIVVVSDGQPLWFRLVATIGGFVCAVSLLLLRPSRRWYGDDARRLALPQ